MSDASYVRAKIKAIENQYEISFGKILLRLSDRRISALITKIDHSRFQIDLPVGFGRRALLEDLYHELGHAFRWRYGLCADKRRLFFSGRAAGVSSTILNDSDSEERVAGFASFYAMENQEEDFCESFSAFLVNNGRTSGVISYDSERIDLTKDSILKAKLKAIKSILIDKVSDRKPRKSNVRNAPERTFASEDSTYTSIIDDNFRAELRKIQASSPLKGI